MHAAAQTPLPDDDLYCCTAHDVGACPYAFLAFPCPCSTNCCGVGIPPCGYNPLAFLCRLPYYRKFTKHPHLRWIPLFGDHGVSCGLAIPITVFLQPEATLTLLVSHGNGQDLQYLAEDVAPRLLQGLTTRVNIVCYEYPGYSLSPLPTSEGLCLRAAQAAYRYAREVLRVPARRIVPYGISLGTGPAVHLAARCEVGGLILQSPYTSIGATKTGLALARRLSCIDLFRSYALAARVRVPVAIYHGSVDQVVPPECSRDLAPMFEHVFGDGPTFCRDAGHNNVIELLHARGEYLPMIESYLRAAERGFHAASPLAPICARVKMDRS
jgi:pimeloyl-ACP methyl ester carboxylesterase